MLLFFMFFQAFAMAAISPLVYNFIIKKQGSILSYAICYTLLPLFFLGPFHAFRLFNIRNQVFRFALGTVMPVTCLFKTTAATYGFTPDYAKTSMASFALFYATPMLMTRDPKLDKFAPNTTEETLGNVKSFFIALFIAGALQSLFNFVPGLVTPFAQGQLPPDHDWYKLSTLLYPQKWLLRNLLFAFYFQVKLTTFAAGLTAAQGLATGNKANSAMENPCMTSRSVSQFWGSKWNLVIHDALKLGVYLPVRKFFPKMVAMVSTFLASGLFHEILLQMFTYPLDDKEGCLSDESAMATKIDCFTPKMFTTTWFFLWQAILIALEYSPIGQMKFWGKVPTSVCTFNVLVAGGAFAHYFVEPYWNSLCFENASVMFFVFKPLSQVAAV